MFVANRGPLLLHLLQFFLFHIPHIVRISHAIDDERDVPTLSYFVVDGDGVNKVMTARNVTSQVVRLCQRICMENYGMLYYRPLFAQSSDVVQPSLLLLRRLASLGKFTLQIDISTT